MEGFSEVDQIQNLFDQLNVSITSNVLVPQQILICPYINEKILVPNVSYLEDFDRVNTRKINELIVNAIMKVSKCRPHYIPPIVSRKRVVSSPRYNPMEFLLTIRSFFKENISVKQIILVTHSNFLKRLTSLALFRGKKIRFKNLDMFSFELDMNSHTYSHKSMHTYRYPYKDVQLDQRGDVTHGELRRVILMRHCVACHNKTNISLYHKFVYNRSGSLSTCLPETTENIKKAAEFIQCQFKLNETCMFGCSVSFRAILTCVLLVNALRNHPDQ